MPVRPFSNQTCGPILCMPLFFFLLTLNASAANVEVFDAVTPVPFDGDVRDLPFASRWQPGDPIKEVPRGGGLPANGLPPPPVNFPDPGPDPLLELQSNVESEGQGRISSTSINMNGQGFSGANPPDTVGDVGPNHYIQIINGSAGTTFTIYNKSGVLQAGPTTLATLGSGNCASGQGDPIVLYDQLADRWLMSEFSGSANSLCVYISKTANPITGGWFNYEFTTPSFPDYPKYAVWPDAYYVTTNESSSTIYALDRSKMLLGQAATMQRFSAPNLPGFGFQALTPADLDGAMPPPANAPNYAMRHRDDEVHNAASNNPSQDFLEIWEFHVDFTTPANSVFVQTANITVTEFDSSLCGLTSFSCFPQPGSGIALDPLREVIMWRLQYRNFGGHQSLVGTFVTDVDDTDRGGIRWFELRNTGAGWSLFQEGSFSPDATNRWMGSIAMDGSGNIVVAYNASSSAVHPSLRYAGRLASSPAGTLPVGEFTLVAGSAANASNRYGDYSAMSVDPADDCTFWFTGEYNAASLWSTRIGSFKFNECGGGGGGTAIFADGFESGDTSAWTNSVP